ncbi:hypothetical protein [Dyella sp.]|uniref:hypothetical protein n=1 Tax=Dyella sp. TaxID=1869338 RepID=UPI002ED083D4
MFAFGVIAMVVIACWLMAATIGLVFKFVFTLIGGMFSLIGALFGLVFGLVALVIAAPLMLLALLPALVPTLCVVGLVWLVVRATRSPQPGHAPQAPPQH